ncbi:MAG: diaminopimelate decarboxylase [Cyclobacteriaceae bacterium]|jgi:diaminopimelate decarboxylase
MKLSSFIGDFQTKETPFYFYDIALLQQTIDKVKESVQIDNAHIHYALKANVDPYLLRLIKEAGFGADCVSGNEVRKAIEVGFDPKDIVFAGVGKTDKEIAYALSENIFSFNVESIEELYVLNELAGKEQKIAQFALRINPLVDAGTHEYITTGTRDNKFGVTIDELWGALDQINELKHLHFIGIHFHIGSQITDLNTFVSLSAKVNELQARLVESGYELPHINVGGGLGIDYENPDENEMADFESYFSIFKTHLKLLPGQQLHFELGRSIVGQCGSLISRVLYTKKGSDTTFMILDAGMTELIRPALYKAKHKVDILSGSSLTQTYDVVGPICESSDTFAKGVTLPEAKRGDMVAIRSAGAYGQVMANQYNLRELPKAYYSSDV